jgi:hypothetical protein
MIQAYGCLPEALWHSSIIKTFIIFSLIKLCLKQESNIAGVMTNTYNIQRHYQKSLQKLTSQLNTKTI